jgi:hypothetical protein
MAIQAVALLVNNCVLVIDGKLLVYACIVAVDCCNP